METLGIVLQVVAALGLLNVWLLRSGKPTPYRGGSEEHGRGVRGVWFAAVVYVGRRRAEDQRRARLFPGSVDAGVVMQAIAATIAFA